jgi:hypothetical protein
MIQQLTQALDYRRERLTAFQREVLYLRELADLEARRVLNQAAMEALKGFDTSRSPKSSSNL